MSVEPIPDPPWRSEPRPKPAARPPLTRETVVEAALRVLDRDRLAALSMRRVADELDVTAASLYVHVRSKDDLLELVLDRVLGEIEVPEPDPPRCGDQLKEFARNMRRALERHPDVASLAAGLFPHGPYAVQMMERLLRIFDAAGLDARMKAYAAWLLLRYVNAVALDDIRGLPAPGTAGKSPEEVVGMISGYFSSLPGDRFPHVVELGRTLQEPDLREARFEFGLDLIVDRITSRA